MITFLDFLLSLLQPILIPLCFLCAWGFTIALIWSMISTVSDIVRRSQTMHQVPCSNCEFFTNDHRLKCTINPITANTEQAISCQDYTPKS